MTDRPNLNLGSYPTTRMRRNRRDDWNRRLAAENKVSADDLIWPVFVHDEDDARVPIPSLPGINRLSIDQLIADVGEAKSLGIPLVALFPAVDPALKSAEAEEAYNPDNLVCRAVKALKDAHPDMGIMCDVALDPFTEHGHDGWPYRGNQSRAGCRRLRSCPHHGLCRQIRLGPLRPVP